MNIEILNLQTKTPIRFARIKTAIKKVLKQLGLESGHLSFVFVDDRKIRAVNKKYLKHDYATDVLTFDLIGLANRSVIEGEIIISAQTAKRNAGEYKTDVNTEMMLYMIHGILHLLGYHDHHLVGIKKMRAKEQYLLSLLK